MYTVLNNLNLRKFFNAKSFINFFHSLFNDSSILSRFSYPMKAIPTTHNGINFRSKLEARWYIFMKKLGWNIEYEPEVENVYGYQPDFVIFPESNCYAQTKLFIEVKPISNHSEFYSDEYKPFREKVYKSGIFKKEYMLIIVGSNLHLKKEKEFIFGLSIQDEYELKEEIKKGRYFKDTEPWTLLSFTGCPEGDYEGIGFNEFKMDCRNDWIKARRDEKCFYQIGTSNSYADEAEEKAERFVERSWNEAWSELQWKPQ